MSVKKPPHHSLKEPRDWWSIFVSGGGWWVVGLGVGLLIATGVAVTNNSKGQRFDREGVVTEAVVTSKRTRRSDDKTKYYITYRYADQNGRSFSKEAKVGSPLYRSSSEGDRLQIRYLGTQTRTSEFPVGKTARDALFWRFIALGAGAAGLVLLWVRGMQTNRRVLARRHGHLEHATVIDFVEHKSSGSPTGKGHMIWKLASGARGESLTHDYRYLRRIPIGGKINVYVHNGVSTWEGDVGPRPSHKSDLPTVKR